MTADPIEQIREDHARRALRISTHYDGCFLDHRECAVAMLLRHNDECERDNDDLRVVAGQLTDRMVAMQQVVDAARLRTSCSSCRICDTHPPLADALDRLDGAADG